MFKNIIADYEAARPGYPDALFCDILACSDRIGPLDILEIGAGPGQASDYFVRNGFRLTALEISQPQVDYLESKYFEYPNFRAVCSRFEDFSADEASFDIIFSATAFHWIAPEVGYPKAYRLLRRGGVLAVFWHLASILEPPTEMLQQIRAIYREIAPELDDYLNIDAAEELHQLRLKQIQTGALFHQPVSRVYRWEDIYTTQRYLKLMNSYSDFHSISSEKREEIQSQVAAYIKSKGGSIVIPQEVRLYLAIKE